MGGRARLKFRTDSNQTEIIDWFRAAGASVKATHMVGEGFVDIVVGYQGLNCLIEIKDGSKPPSKRELTPEEVKFFEGWGGMALVVESTEDCQNVLRILSEYAQRIGGIDEPTVSG